MKKQLKDHIGQNDERGAECRVQQSRTPSVRPDDVIHDESTS